MANVEGQVIRGGKPPVTVLLWTEYGGDYWRNAIVAGGTMTKCGVRNRMGEDLQR